MSILGIDVSQDQQKVYIAWQVSRVFFSLICVPVYLDHISSIPGKCPIPRRVSAYVPHFKGASNTNQPFLSCMLAANCSLHNRYRKYKRGIPGRAPIVVVCIGGHCWYKCIQWHGDVKGVRPNITCHIMCTHISDMGSSKNDYQRISWTHRRLPC